MAWRLPSAPSEHAAPPAQGQLPRAWAHCPPILAGRPPTLAGVQGGGRGVLPHCGARHQALPLCKHQPAGSAGGGRGRPGGAGAAWALACTHALAAQPTTSSQRTLCLLN